MRSRNVLFRLPHLRSLCRLDDHDARRGANAVVASSIAAARAFARDAGQPLPAWIAAVTGRTEPLPMPRYGLG